MAYLSEGAPVTFGWFGFAEPFSLTVESAAATQQRVPSDRGAAGGLNRRVEVHAPIAQAPTPTNPDPVPKRTPNLQEVIERCLRVIRSSPSMPANQRSRLTCLLSKIRDTKTPDLYVNGFSHELRTVPGNLPTDKIRQLFSRARGEILRTAAPGQTDEYVRGALDALDRQILQGIAFLNARKDTHGGATNRVFRILWQWIHDCQRDGTSIYWC